MILVFQTFYLNNLRSPAIKLMSNFSFYRLRGLIFCLCLCGTQGLYNVIQNPVLMPLANLWRSMPGPGVLGHSIRQALLSFEFKNPLKHRKTSLSLGNKQNGSSSREFYTNTGNTCYQHLVVCGKILLAKFLPGTW